MNKNIVCIKAKSAWRLLPSTVITFAKGGFPGLGSELNDPYLPTVSKQWLNGLPKSLHDPA